MSDMTVSEAVAIADRALAYFLDDDEDFRAAVRVLVDHARAAAPESGDLAEVAKLLDSHAAISDRPGQLDQLEALAARVRAHRCAPSVAAPPRESARVAVNDLLHSDGITFATHLSAPGTVRDPERARRQR